MLVDARCIDVQVVVLPGKELVYVCPCSQLYRIPVLRDLSILVTQILQNGSTVKFMANRVKIFGLL